MARAKNVDEVRDKALDVADDLHIEFQKTRKLKVISEAMRAYNMSLTAAKTQLIYGKQFGFGSNTVPFLEPKKK